MKVVLDYYYDDLEQRYTTEECDFTVGPYSEEWTGPCPRCHKGNFRFFRAFGTEAQRSIPVSRYSGTARGRGGII